MDLSLLWAILQGLLAGVTVALVGYIKSMPDGEAFDWKKAGPTLILGALSGAIAFVNNIQMDAAYQLLVQYGLVSLVNSIWVWIVKSQKLGRLVVKKVPA
jgi:hypothetical protein